MVFQKGQITKTAFKKGQSANPNGRPPDALNAAMKQITKEELQDIASLIIKGNVEALKEVRHSMGASAIRVAIVSVVLKIIERGDMIALDKLLDRLIGKVKSEVDLHASGLMPTTVVLRIPDNGRTSKDPLPPEKT